MFDAPFFNLTEKEAISLDPQQRLLLECTYEAFENGGIPKHTLVGQSVGVFVGGSFADYELRNCRDTETAPMYQATGCAASLLANRISYYFDLSGPSFTVDTACSSSLSALHLACQSLRSGESSQAVVASGHLNILPDYFITMSMSRSADHIVERNIILMQFLVCSRTKVNPLPSTIAEADLAVARVLVLLF